MSSEGSIETQDAVLLKQQGTDAYKAGDFEVNIYIQKSIT